MSKVRTIPIAQQRVLTERNELRDKVVRLSAFICGGDKYKELPIEEKELLQLQVEGMEKYLDALLGRIRLFNIKTRYVNTGDHNGHMLILEDKETGENVYWNPKTGRAIKSGPQPNQIIIWDEQIELSAKMVEDTNVKNV